MNCTVLRHVDNFQGNYMNAQRVDFGKDGSVKSITIADGDQQKVIKPGHTRDFVHETECCSQRIQSCGRWLKHICKVYLLCVCMCVFVCLFVRG